ncbi:hypothetical protein [Paracoccus sp. (in: a-proteobacteria)]|uniref:hypothetical protein n=1 Tax=Paracoccus sp. TaxID=267 RepID=UPI003220921C
MANVIRTKFRVLERQHEGGTVFISLVAAVNGKLADAESGTSGGGSIGLATADPRMAAHFLPGTTFYVDFSEV